MTTEVFGHRIEAAITDRETLRTAVGEPSHRAANKVIDHVDALARRFIAAAPFAALATRRPDGGVDVTPRGDPPGFVAVLDETTLALPERPGNRRVDALENILADPRVGLLFMIPGHRDTLRVSGEARIVRDRALADRLAVRGKAPELVVLIRVERVLSHCPKALIRSGLWQPEAWPDRADVPSLAQLIVAHAGVADDVAEVAAIIDNDSRTRLY